MPDGLIVIDERQDISSSSSSSNGMVQELTMDADLKLAREELPDELAELTEETVDIVDMGDIVEVRPLRELKPLSLLLWLCDAGPTEFGER